MLRENWNDAGPGFHPVSSSDYLPAAQLRDDPAVRAAYLGE